MYTHARRRSTVHPLCIFKDKHNDKEMHLLNSIIKQMAFVGHVLQGYSRRDALQILEKTHKEGQDECR